MADTTSRKAEYPQQVEHSCPRGGRIAATRLEGPTSLRHVRGQGAKSPLLNRDVAPVFFWWQHLVPWAIKLWAHALY
jgi:hypothetical protein